VLYERVLMRYLSTQLDGGLTSFGSTLKANRSFCDVTGWFCFSLWVGLVVK
jgi:hypothetical protein